MKQNSVHEYSYECGCSFRVEVRYDTGWALCGAHSYTQLASCGDSEMCGGVPTLDVGPTEGALEETWRARRFTGRTLTRGGSER